MDSVNFFHRDLFGLFLWWFWGILIFLFFCCVLWLGGLFGVNFLGKGVVLDISFCGSYITYGWVVCLNKIDLVISRMERFIEDLRDDKDFEILGMIHRKLESSLLPFTDIYERDGVLLVVMDVPGFSREEIEVRVKNGSRLSVSGKREKELANYLMDGRALEFETELRLPCEVMDEGEAKLENGVLTVELEKVEDEGSSIEIQ
ncbi:Molecular chaperone HSP20 family, IbpA [Methanonatronarchaeum thermophilum]|uniref:Molecular chaperone HSP20 family, IbpA n=1 Tax=Methanonatronarchaeum thermophilum TaxID=1927129 RepID=A0A1Y3G9Y6_9EURY|nr:Molecular chaperone HSP20 family, IbpA [Methanonatronarchaeum thermophilum]